MKKSGILILVIVFILLLVFTVIGSIFKAKESLYVVEQDGYIINESQSYEVASGSKVRTTSGNTIFVNGTTYEGNSFYVTNDKNEIIVLNDAYLALDDGNIKVIEQNTKIKVTGAGYEYNANGESITFESGVIYNSDDPSYLVLGRNNKVLQHELSDQFVLTLSEGGSTTFLNIDDMTLESYIMGDELISVADGTIDPKAKTYINGESIVVLSETPIIEEVPPSDEPPASDEKQDEEPVTNDEQTTESNTSNSDNSSSDNSQTSSNNVSDNTTAATTNPNEGASNINGLGKFFYDLFTFKPDYVPEMVLTVNPTYTTVTFDISVEDVGATFESLNLQLTNKKTNEITYHSISVVDGGASLKVTNLTPGTEYKYDFIITYVNGDGKTASNLAKSGVFTTKNHEIIIETYEVLDHSITFKIEVPDELTYKSANVVIYNENDIVLDTKAINFEEIKQYGFTYVTFNNLDSNATYKVYIEDVLLADQTPINISEEQEVLTAKQVPVMSDPVVTVDYINSCFNVKAPHVSDPDYSVEYVTFYAYNFDNTQTPIAQQTIPFNSANANHKFCLNSDAALKRNKNYKFAIELSGNNNYDDFKLKSKTTDSYMIDGIAPPSANIEILATTEESITGTVMLTDDEGAITTNATLQIKDTTTDTVMDSMIIGPGLTEFSFGGLEPGTSYTIEVITTFDLENSNPPYNNYPITSISTYTNSLLNKLAFWKE